ncbi:MAG: HD domain-containing protein [Anaerolineaceae bacterium]|nr:HD domain-containing protein [Anaerolineaceae bacterium]
MLETQHLPTNNLDLPLPNPRRSPEDSWLTDGLTSEECDQLAAVLQLLHICCIPLEHTHHVTRLSLRLFDALQPLHKLGSHERFWLECAALLHDIGWIEGQKNHHKNSLQIILTTPLLPIDQKKRLLVGSIARYHRGVLPLDTHDHYHALDAGSRILVSTLAAFLRLADGLDGSHQCLVSSLACKISKKRIEVRCTVNATFTTEKEDAEQRSDLLQLVFKRKVIIQAGKPH